MKPFDGFFVRAYRSANMNGGLTSSWVAFETVCRQIASTLFDGKPKGTQITSWGRALASLNEAGFLDRADENARSIAYTHISRGAHVPVGFSGQDWVRLSRQLALWYCYFLIKRFNGSQV